jgi:hypothetical protein
VWGSDTISARHLGSNLIFWPFWLCHSWYENWRLFHEVSIPWYFISTLVQNRTLSSAISIKVRMEEPMWDLEAPDTTAYIVLFPQRLVCKGFCLSLEICKNTSQNSLPQATASQVREGILDKILSRMWTLDNGLNMKVFYTKFLYAYFSVLRTRVSIIKMCTHSEFFKGQLSV